jgi:ATP-binding cassette subfamily F protein uup
VVNYSEGNYDYYVEKKKRAAAPPAAGPGSKVQSPKSFAAAPSVTPVAPEAEGQERFKEQKELEGMGAAIHTAEAEVARLEALLATPDFFRTQGAKANAVIAELDAAKAKATQLFARWEELEAIRAAAA